MSEQQNMKRDRYLNLLAEVAYMYYERNMIQSQIAEELCISRSRISRLLQAARDEGVVKIQIRRAGERAYELEERLKRKFKLSEVIVINETEDNNEHFLDYLGQNAASLIEQTVKPGQTVGMSWGRSVTSTVNSLKGDKNLKINVVQIIGGAMSENANVEQNDIILRMIRKFDGKGFLLSAPLYLSDSGTRDTLVKQPVLAFTLEKAASADLIITGIGNISQDTFSFMWSGYHNDEELKHLNENNAVGFICGQAYDINGDLIKTGFNEKIIGIRLTKLRKIKNVLAIAGGEQKASAVLGALRGQYINMLVTDTSCVHKILELDRK